MTVLPTKETKKKPLTVEELLAYGVGVIGLSVAGWSGLSPDEFEAVCRSYNEAEEQRLQGEWERMRSAGDDDHPASRQEPLEA